MFLKEASLAEELEKVPGLREAADGPGPGWAGEGNAMEGEGFGAEGRQAEVAGGRAHAAHWDAPGQYVFLCTFLD